MLRYFYKHQPPFRLRYSDSHPTPMYQYLSVDLSGRRKPESTIRNSRGCRADVNYGMSYVWNISWTKLWKCKILVKKYY